MRAASKDLLMKSSNTYDGFNGSGAFSPNGAGGTATMAVPAEIKFQLADRSRTCRSDPEVMEFLRGLERELRVATDDLRSAEVVQAAAGLRWGMALVQLREQVPHKKMMATYSLMGIHERTSQKYMDRARKLCDADGVFNPQAINEAREVLLSSCTPQVAEALRQQPLFSKPPERLTLRQLDCLLSAQPLPACVARLVGRKYVTRVADLKETRDGGSMRADACTGVGGMGPMDMVVGNDPEMARLTDEQLMEGPEGFHDDGDGMFPTGLGDEDLDGDGDDEDEAVVGVQGLVGGDAERDDDDDENLASAGVVEAPSGAAGVKGEAAVGGVAGVGRGRVRDAGGQMTLVGVYARAEAAGLELVAMLRAGTLEETVAMGMVALLARARAVAGPEVGL